MKIMKHILLAVLASGLLAGCTSNTNKGAQGCSDDQFGCAPDEVHNNSFTEISFDDAINFFKEGKTGVLYFGFEGCPWCQEILPILEEQKEKNSLDVYWIKTRDEEGERLYTDEQREAIKPYIQDYMKNNSDGELTLYVPLVLNVKNGEVLAGHQGTVKGHNAHDRKMNDDEKAEVESIYEEMFEYK